MDDYIQILIYLFIIFAFLNSLFKKKDKEKSPPRPSNSPDNSTRNTYSSPGYEKKGTQGEYDILKEIEGLFKGESDYTSQRKMESDAEKAEMRKVPPSEHTEDKEWHTEDSEWHSEDSEWHSENTEWHSESEEWHEQSATEHKLDKSWHSITEYKRSVKVDAAIEQEAERFERMLADRNKEVPYPFRHVYSRIIVIDERSLDEPCWNAFLMLPFYEWIECVPYLCGVCDNHILDIILHQIAEGSIHL